MKKMPLTLEAELSGAEIDGIAAGVDKRLLDEFFASHNDPENPLTDEIKKKIEDNLNLLNEFLGSIRIS